VLERGADVREEKPVEKIAPVERDGVSVTAGLA
jgi:hypothetical protein